MVKNKIKKGLKSLALPSTIIAIVVVVLLLNQNLINFINRDAASILEIREFSDVENAYNNVKGSLTVFPTVTEERIFTQSFSKQISEGSSYTETVENKSSDVELGVNISWVFRTLPKDDFKINYLLDDGNIKIIREEFNWGEIEKSSGSSDYSRYDDIVNRYNERDVKIVGLLAYSAPWASTAPLTISKEREFYPPDLNEWKNFVSDTVSRYKGKVHAWEIWNEPNEPYFFRSPQSNYFNLLKESYGLIKSIDPEAKVINAGITWPDPTYVQNFYSSGMGDYTDGFATHTYYCDQGIDQGNYGKLRDDLTKAYDIMQNYNRNHKLWITEIGCSSYKYSEEQQATQLVKMLVTVKSLPYVETALWYVLRDTDIGAEAGKYGLVTSDYGYKKAWSAWNQATTNK